MWREVEFLSCSSDRQPEMHSSSSIFGPVVYCAVCTVLMASDISNELCPNPNNSTDAAGMMFKFICDLYYITLLLTDFIITDQSNELICCLMILLVFFSSEQGGLVLGLGVSCLVAILAVSPGYFGSLP